MVRRKNNKQLVYEKQAQIIKAVAHPLRVGIVDFLSGGPQCVCDIAEYVDAERSNASRHLSVMTSAGILDSYKDGLMVMYQLKTPCIIDFIKCVTKCIKQQAKAGQRVLQSV